MLPKAPVVCAVILCAVVLSSYADFPQLHRALPGANGKPGYRTTSSAKASVDTDNKEVIDKHGYGDKATHAGQQPNTMDFDSQWSQAAFYSIISSILVGLSGILPLIIIPLEAGPSLQHGAGSVMLKLLLSFAVGSLLGDVFLHLLPEAWASVNSAADPHWAHTVIGLWVICGMLSFMTIEKVFSETEEEEEEEPKVSERTVISEECSPKTNGTSEPHSLRSRTNGVHSNGVTNGTANGAANGVANGSANGKPHSNGKTTHKEKDEDMEEEEHENKNIHITGYLNLLANCIDNFTHGLAVAGSYLISPKVGLCTTIAILLHEIPHEVGDFAILLRSGFDRWKAAKAQILTASGGLLGALTALMSESAEKAGDRTAAILPFTAGGFIYIALVTIVPELLKEKCPKESLKQTVCIIMGVLSMMLVTVLFEG